MAEDGVGDVTSEATVPEGTWGRGVVLAKGSGVLSGAEVARAVFDAPDELVRAAEGHVLAAGALVGTYVRE